MSSTVFLQTVTQITCAKVHENQMQNIEGVVIWIKFDYIHTDTSITYIV